MNRNRRRQIFATTFIVGLIGCWAPAVVSAHTEFEDAPATIAPDTDIPLTMHVAHERGDAVYNVGVAIRLPEGWTGVSCETKPTWSCAIATESQRVVVRFDKDAGAAPAEDETFNVVLHSSTAAGTASFPTLQTYNTGEEVGWVGDAGSDAPAPTLEVAAAAAPTTPTTAVAPTTAATTAPTTTLAPSTSVAPATTDEVTTTGDTTAGTVTLAPTATQPTDAESDDDNTAVWIVIAVLVVGAATAGTIIYMRHRNGPVPPPV